MAKGYHHVTREERSQIRLLKAMRYSISEIARRLKRHRSTITLEIKRDGGPWSYYRKQAHKKATERRSAASRRPKKMTPEFNEVTHEELAAIEEHLNHRPRKILGYKTPYEVFYQRPDLIASRICSLC